MRALVWHGKEDIRCETVPDPKIEQPRDAILKVTSCAICGSDLHLYDHFMIGMQKGDVIRHELWGRVTGDALDIGTLAYGYRRDPDDVTGIAAALAAVGGATAADVYCAAKLSGESKIPLPPVKDYSNRSGCPNGRPPAGAAVVSETVVVSA
jgi:hypothetical protein